MNDVLVDVLRDRAELAPDPDELWDDIVRGIDVRRGRRRATVAAAGASAAVATAAITAVAIVPARAHHRVLTGQAPPRVSSSVPAPATRPVRSAPARLVPVKPAPEPAKLVLSLVPEGWRYLGARTSSTTYSDHGGSPDDFAGKLVLLYGEPTQKSYPLEVGAHPGAIWKSGDVVLVEARLSSTRALTVQVPASLALSKAQLIELLGSATVRAGAVVARG